MARKKKEKVVVKEINNLNDLLESVYHSNYCLVWGYGKFLTRVNSRIREEKENFLNNINEKKKELEETPLTRKQFDDAIAELEKRKGANIFTYPEFDFEEELFQKNVLSFYISKQVNDEKKAEEIYSFIWAELDFMSLVFFFRNHDYAYCDDCQYNYTDNGEYSPESSNHIYEDVSFNKYIYQGNMVDKIIKLFDK